MNRILWKICQARRYWSFSWGNF